MQKPHRGDAGLSDTTVPLARVSVERNTPAGLLARVRRYAYVILWIAIAAGGLGWGIDYYLTPMQDRPFSPLYEKFRPAGSIGIRYGIIGLALITLGVMTYSFRKRIPFMSRAGKLKSWLEFHIFVCSVGPFLVLLHTSFKIGGLVSIAFWSMAVVALSGIFGRYVYVRIPKTVQGQFTDIQELEKERRRHIQALAEDLGPRLAEFERAIRAPALARSTGFVGALVAAIRFDLNRRSVLARARRTLAAAAISPDARQRVLALLERQLDLEHDLALAIPFQRLFRYWHLLHLPLAFTMFIVVAVHVAVATMFGYGWSR